MTKQSPGEGGQGDLTHIPPDPTIATWGEPEPGSQQAAWLRATTPPSVSEILAASRNLPAASRAEVDAQLRAAALSTVPWFKRGGIMAAIIAAVLVVGSVVGIYVNDAFFTKPVTQTSGNPAPTIVPIPIRKTNLQQTLDRLGPWRSVATSSNNTANPAILELKQDNGTVASTRFTVPFEGNPWVTVTTPPEIGRLTLAGQTVELQTTTHQVFVVGVMQPLLLEQQPAALYLIDPSGRFWELELTNPHIQLMPLTDVK